MKWENWPQETRKAVDLFNRLCDVNFKDRIMGKASNDVRKLTTEYIEEHYRRTIAGKDHHGLQIHIRFS